MDYDKTVAFQEGSEAIPVPEDSYGTSLYKTAKAGLYDASAGAQAYIGDIAHTWKERGFDTGYAEELARQNEQSARTSADETYQSMSPEALEGLRSSLTSEEFWTHPGMATSLKLAGMTPSLALSLVGAEFAGGAGLALTGAMLSGGGYAENVSRKIDDTDDQQLIDSSDAYAGMRSMGMSEIDAKQALKHQAVKSDMLVKSAIGAAANLLGPEAMISKTGLAPAVTGTLGRRAALGAAEGGIPNYIDDADTAYRTQEADIDVGLQKTPHDYGSDAEAGIESGVLGGLIGGAHGAAFGKQQAAPSGRNPFTYTVPDESGESNSFDPARQVIDNNNLNRAFGDFPDDNMLGVWREQENRSGGTRLSPFPKDAAAVSLSDYALNRQLGKLPDDNMQGVNMSGEGNSPDAAQAAALSGRLGPSTTPVTPEGNPPPAAPQSDGPLFDFSNGYLQTKPGEQMDLPLEGGRGQRSAPAQIPGGEPQGRLDLQPEQQPNLPMSLPEVPAAILEQSRDVLAGRRMGVVHPDRTNPPPVHPGLERVVMPVDHAVVDYNPEAFKTAKGKPVAKKTAETMVRKLYRSGRLAEANGYGSVPQKTVAAKQAKGEPAAVLQITRDTEAGPVPVQQTGVTSSTLPQAVEGARGVTKAGDRLELRPVIEATAERVRAAKSAVTNAVATVGDSVVPAVSRAYEKAGKAGKQVLEKAKRGLTRTAKDKPVDSTATETLLLPPPQTPKLEAPKVEAPKVEAKAPEPPKAEPPKAEAPAVSTASRMEQAREDLKGVLDGTGLTPKAFAAKYGVPVEKVWKYRREETNPEANQGGKHRSNAEQEAISNKRTVAEDVLKSDNFAPDEARERHAAEANRKAIVGEHRMNLFSRMSAILDHATKNGYTFAERIKKSTDANMSAADHAPTLFLDEVRRFVNAYNNGERGKSIFDRIIKSEQLARAGDAEIIHATRLEIGDKAKRRDAGGDVENLSASDPSDPSATRMGIEADLSPEERLIQKEEAGLTTRGNPQPARPSRPPLGSKPLTEAERAERKARLEAEAKAAAEREQARKDKIRRDNFNKRFGPSLEEIGPEGTFNDSETNTSYAPLYTRKLSDVLKASDYRNSKGFGGQLRAFMPLLVDRIAKSVGEMDVHFVDGPTMDKMSGERGTAVPGFYSSENGHIVLRDNMNISEDARRHYILHEALHAGITHALEGNTKLKASLEKLQKHVLDTLKGEEGPLTYSSKQSDYLENHYGFAQKTDGSGELDVHEFMAEAISNPRFQEHLHRVELPPELARELGINDSRTKFMSAWDGIKTLLRRWLGLPPAADTALDAAMSSFDRLMAGREVFTDSGKGFDRGRGDTRHFGPSMDRMVERADPYLAEGSGVLRNFTNRHLRTTQQIAEKIDQLRGGDSQIGRSIYRLSQAMRAAADTYLKSDGKRSLSADSTFKRLEDAEAKNPADYKAADELVHRASEVGWNLFGENNHLKNSPADHQAKAIGARLQREFDKLDPAVKSAFTEQQKYYSEQHEVLTKGLIKSQLADEYIEADDALVDKIYNGKLTDEDLAPYGDQADAISDVNKMVLFRKMKGTYVPLSREGDYVVRAKQNITSVPKGGVLGEEDGHKYIQLTRENNESVPEFRERIKKYIDQLGEQDIYTAHKEIVEEGDPTKRTEAEQLDATDAYRLHLKDDYHFAGSEREAKEEAARLTSTGNYTVKPVVTRGKYLKEYSGMSSKGLRQLEQKLKSSDKFKALDKNQQDMQLEALREQAARLLPGNKIQTRFMRRRGVAGYDVNSRSSLARYAAGSSNYRARLEYAGDLDRLMAQLQDDVDNTYRKSNVSVPLSELNDELAKRVYNKSDAPQERSVFNKVTKRLLQLSLVDKLGGVSTQVVNLTEPSLVSLPYIAGEHGKDTLGVFKKMYDVLNPKSALGASFKDTVAAMTQRTGFTDYGDFFKQAIDDNLGKANPQMAADYKAVIDYMRKYGHMDPGSEFEIVEEATRDSGFVGKKLDAAERMVRQTMTAAEGINRAVTALTKYEMARRDGMSHEDAMDAAYFTVGRTMGNFANSNMPAFFNNNTAKIVTQFHKYGFKQYALLGELMKASLSSLSGAEAVQARKQLAGVLAGHMAFAGVRGLPTGPIKTALALSGVLLGTSFTPDDFDDLVRDKLAEWLGPDWGEVAARGLPRMVGLDLSQKLALDSLLVRDMPKSAKVPELQGWLGSTLWGAAPDTLGNMLLGAHALMKDDLVGASKLVPIRAVHDVVAAGDGFFNGKTSKRGFQTMAPYSAGEALLRATGFRGAREVETQEAQSRAWRTSHNLTTQRGELTAQYFAARTQADRSAAWREIRDWNANQPDDAKITYGELQKETANRQRGMSQGKYWNGQRVTKNNRHIFNQINKTYGIR